MNFVFNTTLRSNVADWAVTYSVKYLETLAKFPLPLATLDKILNYLGPFKNLEILNKNLAKILVKESGR